MAGAKGLIGAIRVGVIADTRKATKSIDTFGKRLGRFSKSAKSALGRTTRVFSAFFGVAGIGGIAGFAASLKTTAEEIDNIAKSADKLGTGTEELIRMRHAAKIFGTDAESVQKGMQRMLKSVADANAGLATQLRAFEMIGLETGMLENLKADQMFLRIAEGIRSLNTEAKQMQATQDIFGRGGTEMLNMIKASGDELLATFKQADDAGLTFSREQARKVEAFNDAIVNLKAAIGGQLQDLMIEMAPALEQAVKDLTLIVPSLVTFANEFLTAVVKLERILPYVSPAYAVYRKFVQGRSEEAKARTGTAPIPERRGRFAEGTQAILQREMLENNREQINVLQEIARNTGAPAFDIP